MTALTLLRFEGGPLDGATVENELQDEYGWPPPEYLLRFANSKAIGIAVAEENEVEKDFGPGIAVYRLDLDRTGTYRGADQPKGMATGATYVLFRQHGTN